MPLADLDHQELVIVEGALRLMAGGQVVEEMEFGTRMGLTLSEFREPLARWPAVDDRASGSSAWLAINNTLNDLLNGVGISDTQCRNQLGAGCDEVERVFRKWKCGDYQGR